MKTEKCENEKIEERQVRQNGVMKEQQVQLEHDIFKKKTNPYTTHTPSIGMATENAAPPESPNKLAKPPREEEEEDDHYYNFDEGY